MELRYIRIEEYNCIKQTGFNLSNSDNHSFKYSNGELTVYRTNSSALSFSENINSIIAIVGENGSGKSSLFEMIRDAMK